MSEPQENPAITAERTNMPAPRQVFIDLAHSFRGSCKLPCGWHINI